MSFTRGLRLTAPLSCANLVVVVVGTAWQQDFVESNRAGMATDTAQVQKVATAVKVSAQKKAPSFSANQLTLTLCSESFSAKTFQRKRKQSSKLQGPPAVGG